jgi:hypothetical protein
MSPLQILEEVHDVYMKHLRSRSVAGQFPTLLLIPMERKDEFEKALENLCTFGGLKAVHGPAEPHYKGMRVLYVLDSKIHVTAEAES